MIRRLLTLFIVLNLLSISFATRAMAQLPPAALSWKNVSVGGTKVAVFSLYTDSRSLVWVGTNSGLYFYDGVTTHDVGFTTLLGAQVYAMVEWHDGLYLGTNNGLYVYSYATGVLSPYHVATPKELRTLLLVGDQLWMGGLNGVGRLDLNSKRVTNVSRGLPHRSVYSLLRDGRGIIYAGTYNGLARFDSRQQVFAAIQTPIGGAGNGNFFVNSLLETADGQHIYVGGEGFLFRFTPANRQWQRVAALQYNNVKCLAESSEGYLLVGTDDGLFSLRNDGITHYRHDSRQEQSLANNEIWCAMADNRHRIWVGHERGFSIASSATSIHTVKLSSLAHSGEGNEIHAIFRDTKGNLWLAGTNGAIKLAANGLTAWYRHNEQQRSLSHNRVRALIEDHEGRVWFATDAGVNRFNGDGSFDVFHVVDGHGRHLSNWVYALVEQGNHLWVGSYLSGLHYVDKRKLADRGRTVVADLSVTADTRLKGGVSLPSNLVNNVVADHRGNLWILLFRDSCVTMYSPHGGKARRFDIGRMVHAAPTHIAADRQGRVWCAFKGGVVMFQEGRQPVVVRFAHTSSDETVLAMGAVDSGVWVSTQSNVWAIDGHSLQAKLMPIPQGAYTAVYEDTLYNKVYLGGADEIVEIDHRRLAGQPSYQTIRMVVEDEGDGVYRLNHLMADARGLRIPYGGSVALLVSTLNYSPESVHRYMYRLASSPADTTDGWVVMGEGMNRIAFSDLRMGHYALMVKTVGATSAPTVIELRVSAPWPLSWWAITVYVLLVVGMVCWVVWYMRRRAERSMQEHERQAALENVEKKLSFLSSVFHDLKTPLSMILGPASIMKDKAHDAESRHTMTTIYDNAVKLKNMINRTLELQHVDDTSEHLLVITPVELVGFCRDVYEAFREANADKHFVFHASCSRLMVEADAVMLESVVSNLLSNACKYSGSGSTISVGVDLRGQMAEVVVADDGVGIADNDQWLVFQKSFRSPTTSATHEGSGLGLYLIKKYLEMMHGNIDLYSKEGQGTSFAVTLPVATRLQGANDEISAAESTTAMTTAEETAAAEEKPKALVVEDNQQISSFIVSVLSDSYTCLTAPNGRAGLAIAASFVPHLMIIDEMMPVMTGLDMVRRVKQYPRLSAIPIVMLTAKSDSITENESLRLGVDLFMAKPFEPQVLVERVSRLIKLRAEMMERVRVETIARAEEHPIEAQSVGEKLLAKIAKTIEDNIADPDLNVNMLCEKTGIANKQLYRLVKKHFDISPLDYIRSVRLRKAAMLLEQQRFTVAEISYMVGFKTPSYFAKCFQNVYGATPSQYAAEHSG